MRVCDAVAVSLHLAWEAKVEHEVRCGHEVGYGPGAGCGFRGVGSGALFVHVFGVRQIGHHYVGADDGRHRVAPCVLLLLVKQDRACELHLLYHTV